MYLTSKQTKRIFEIRAVVLLYAVPPLLALLMHKVVLKSRALITANLSVQALEGMLQLFKQAIIAEDRVTAKEWP